MRIVSQLDLDGWYAGPVVADESPLEPGVYLIPGGAVDMPPPDVPAGQRARPVDGEWVFETTPEAPAAADPQADTQAGSPGVPMAGVRIALLRAGLLDRVEALIAAAPAPAGPELQIAWEYAATVHPDHPLVAYVATGLGLADISGLLAVAAVALAPGAIQLH